MRSIRVLRRLSAVPLGAFVLASCVSRQIAEERAAVMNPPEPASEIVAFIVRLGTDTIGVERITRTGNRIESESFTRNPAVTTRNYTATLNPDGTVSNFEYSAERPNGGAPPQRIIYNYAGDSIGVSVQRGDSAARVSKIGATGVMPLVGTPAYGLLELMTMRAIRAGADSAGFTVLSAGAAQTTPIQIVRVGPDSVRIGPAANPVYARVDRQGRLLGVNGMRTTQKFIVERVPTADVRAIAQSFAQREREAGAMRAFSRDDTLHTTAGGARLTISYGRPVKRGRLIVGSREDGAVVPYGEVWRTGANFATHLTTDADLLMAGTTIPAGMYTLWTLPTPSGWKLIVNKQVVAANGRSLWGTQYDASQDLVRLDLPATRLAQPVEVFTIAVDPTDTGGTLKMMWDDVELRMPFTVRR
jgi:hypothetical protein